MDRKQPNKQHARNAEWSDKEVQRFESYSTMALSHAMGRNGRVVKILCYLSLMRCAGNITANASRNVVAALWQNYSSTAGNQAAHYLPGQLMINSQQLSNLIKDPQTRNKINCLFGDVEDLPADFNKADTQAEAKGRAGGFCEAFREAARYVIANNTSLPNTKNASVSSNIDRTVVRYAYQNVWIPKARIACHNALLKKAEKYTKPEIEYGTKGGFEYGMITNLSARENASQYKVSINCQQEIIHHYLRSFDKSWEPSELCDTAMNELARGFKS
ncbi:MAG: hypothetical protein H6974_15140 [Gammaproteobacteria bacterium]|nr:hypothetical protein [Gammaproteobacteria bacterium]